MQKQCESCGVEFEVEDADLAFLKRMREMDPSGIAIPAPKWCPQCRQMRRMAFRNQRNLYTRKCDVTGKQIFSVIAPDSKYKVCDKDYFYGDEFEPLNYGRDFDFERPFFEQFQEIMLEMPLPALRVERSENCDYNNDMSDCANCYLCSRTHKSSDMMYTYRGNKSTSCVDSYQAVESELLYECVECLNCYNCRYCYFSTNCSDSAFLYDCHGCRDCTLCANLRNKQYCFENEQLTKEEYQKKLSGFDFGSYKSVEQALKFFDYWKGKAVKRAVVITNSEGCEGDNIVNSKNCVHSFNVKGAQDGRYLWDVKKYNDSMDIYSGGRGSELVYDATSTTASHNCKFCVRVTYSSDVDYSMYCHNCQNCFGCFGLKGNKFCIFNKEYKEDEYWGLRKKIIEHMVETKEWGEFFPPSLSQFGYNDTVGYKNFPLSEGAAKERGYNWTNYVAPPIEAKKLIEAPEIPDNIDDIKDDILDTAIKCEKTGKPFKIIPQELRFYRKMRIPAPHLSPDERYKLRFVIKPPMKLREDKCSKCGTKITTSYIEGTENVYCDDCYQKLL